MPATDVVVYSSGLVYASVCVPAGLTREEVAARTNFKHPTGTTFSWVVSEDEQFRGGQPMPCRCESDETREHWLLEC